MIITLRGAKFTNNIGTLNSFRIKYNISGGIRKTDGPSYIEKNADGTYAAEDLVVTFSLTDASNEISNCVVTVGESSISIDPVKSGTTVTLTIPAASITGDVVITIEASSATPDVPTPDPEEPEDPVTPTSYTFTINPNPISATVILTATGYTQNGNSITVPNGTTVSWRVSAGGYTEQNGTWTANGKNESKSVKLDQASMGEITTFFTTGTKGSKKESPTINGFTWVMPKTFLTSRVNAITVPVHLYKDEYEYIDLLCEIMEANEAGSLKAPTRKEGMCAITRMTADGDAVFNISFDASDITADCCLIGIRALEKKKIAFKDTSGTSEWKTATANTGSNSGATPCCSYYVTNSSTNWVSSTAANTRYLELSTDAAAAKYTLSYTNPYGIGTGLIRTSSNYGCIGGIAPGADIYAGDVLTKLTENSYATNNDNGEIIDFPITVNGNVDIRLMILGEGGLFFENGVANAEIDSIENGALDYTGWGWVIPKDFVTMPVAKVSVPTMSFRESDVPVEITCELLSSNKTVVKTVTEIVANATGGHDFNLTFTKDDIQGDWGYIAIYIKDAATNGKEFGFRKITAAGDWYNIIKDKTTYPPIYKYGTVTNWTTASSPNLRHIALKTNG